jgi:hypothetical protein
MITQELKQQILSLSPDEQHEIVQLIQAQTNSWAGITKTPGVVGGDAGSIPLFIFSREIKICE